MRKPSPATIVTGTRNRALSCTSPGRNVRANEGSSDGTTLWSKLVDQSSQQPRMGAGHGLDWEFALHGWAPIYKVLSCEEEVNGELQVER
ncbi:hypothetical protein NCS52_00299900 [Fusarium sp. LHS14.1]|nr:hypothetical protein NCS52_00299900 [Fusarium sp. LHS14.1]